jgi:hypothetical protein
MGKIYQMTTKCTKWPKIYHLAVKYGHKKYQNLPLQGLLNFTQIGIFGLKINHLATLLWVCL